MDLCVVTGKKQTNCPDWLVTNEATSVNCNVEEVALESECLACPINFQIGTIPGGLNGSISHNLVL